jgi:hypothetical protein
MSFISASHVAELRHPSEFIGFFCDAVEPNGSRIRVSIGTENRFDSAPVDSYATGRNGQWLIRTADFTHGRV